MKDSTTPRQTRRHGNATYRLWRCSTPSSVTFHFSLFAFHLFVTFAGTAAIAAPASDYLARINSSVETLKELKRDRSMAEEAIANIKQWMPESEDVEAGQRTVTVDNRWLHAMLKEYVEEKDRQKQNVKLDEAIGRLESLASHVDRLETEASSPDSDPKEQIRSILARPQFAEKHESPITRAMREVREKILNTIREIFVRIWEAIFGAGTRANWLMRIIVILAIILSIALIARVAMRYKPERKKSKKRVVLGEEIEEGMSAADLAEAGVAAARAGDFRTAIRKLYIALLYDLSERKLLEIEPYATNRDYLSKVSRFDSLAAPMRYMTECFDYCWYGMFPASEQEFSAYFNRYQEARDRARALGEQAA
jgi:hypothetical protein